MVFTLRRQVGKQDLRCPSPDGEPSKTAYHSPRKINTLFTTFKPVSKEDVSYICSLTKRRTHGNTKPPPSERSSSSSLSDQYKGHSATDKSNGNLHSREKAPLSVSPSAFGECLDSTFPFPANRVPGPQIQGRETSRMNDIELDMLTPHASSHQSPAATGAVSSTTDTHTEAGHTHEKNPSHNRPTRSQIRRRERSDSMHNDILIAAANDGVSPSHSPSRDNSHDTRPLSTRHSTPQESIRQVSPRTPQSSIPATSSTIRPAPTRILSSSDLHSSSPSVLTNVKAKPIAPSSTSRTSRQSKIDTPLPQVVVQPPVPNPSRSALRQWESDRKASSLPLIPWGDSKRWRCCNCSAQTIVEQAVCSRLACGHIRCDDAVCRVVMVRDRVSLDGRWIQIK